MELGVIVVVIILAIVFAILSFNSIGSKLEFFGGRNAQKTVKFHFTNWCPHCINMKPIWAQVKAQTLSTRQDVKFIENNEEEHKTPGIASYPTILLVGSDGKQHKYTGGPDVVALQSFINAHL